MREQGATSTYARSTPDAALAHMLRDIGARRTFSPTDGDQAAGGRSKGPVAFTHAPHRGSPDARTTTALSDRPALQGSSHVNRRLWIASVGATLLVTRLRNEGSRDRGSDYALRLEVETTLFHTVSSVCPPDLQARASDGVARSVDFSNDAVWSELVTEAFATAARTTPFHPEAVDSPASSPEEPGLPVIVAVLRHLAKHPDHQLIVTCPTLSHARARAVVALLEGDRDGFVRAVAGYQTAKADAAILAFASRTRGWPCAPADCANPTAEELAAFQSSYNAEFDQSITIDGRVGDPRAAYFDLFEADATERAGNGDALAWLRRNLDHNVLVVCDDNAGVRSELVELLFKPGADA